jgi:tRNA threonylcarbamoyladenosine biosynthesis protein TsaE
MPKGAGLMKTKEIATITGSPAATQALGKRLGKTLTTGDAVLLFGDLGGGKTVFVKGIAEGLNVSPAVNVSSPTYALLHIYPGDIPLYHADLYRLTGPGDAAAIGLYEILEGDGATVVEWAERLEDDLPPRYITVVFEILGEVSRKIRIHTDRPI